MTSTSKRPMGSQPAKSECNPKEYCNAILSTDICRDELSAHEKEMDKIERLLYRTYTVAKAEAQIVETVEHKVVERIEIQDAEKVVEKLNEAKLEDTPEVEQSPSDKLPFPQRFLTKAQKRVISKFKKDMGDVGVKLLEILNMHDTHVQMMLIKDILAHKEEVAELLDISTASLDPSVPPKSLPKLETQGKFTLSCCLGKFTLDDALVDSGASVNVISRLANKALNQKPKTPASKKT
ncbi:hypothetical protein N665_0141s0003 [Sinapis alba]|nr:hypothetical protein N665_0141s0003 [Sinapis alba]